MHGRQRKKKVYLNYTLFGSIREKGWLAQRLRKTVYPNNPNPSQPLKRRAWYGLSFHRIYAM